MRERFLAAFKAVVYTLLILNVGAFLAVDRSSHRAIDQIGWLIILGIFEYETRLVRAGGSLAGLRPLPLAIEAAGYACALYALGHYIAIADGLEIANEVTWLAISVMIWVDILWPVEAGTLAMRTRSWIKLPLYALTLVWATLWGLAGSILDFYDALLWILCFFVIEINILRIEGYGRPTAPG